MPQNNDNKLGMTLSTKRKELGLSAREVGARAGLNHSTIVRIEKSERMPTPDVLDKIASVLDLSLKDLYTLAGYPVPHDPSDMPLYLRGQYHDLSTDDRKKVDEFIISLTNKRGLKTKGPQDGEDE